MVLKKKSNLTYLVRSVCRVSVWFENLPDCVSLMARPAGAGLPPIIGRQRSHGDGHCTANFTESFMAGSEHHDWHRRAVANNWRS
jgi:hypothetical protein